MRQRDGVVSDNLLNIVFDNLPVFVMVFCNEGRVLFYSKLAEKACGVGIEKLTFGDIFAEDYRAAGDVTSELKYEYHIGKRYYSIVDFYSQYDGYESVRILVGHDITDVKTSIFRYNNRAMIDSMTEVYNREVGINYLREMVSQVKLDNDFFSVAYVDLDNLKYINDNFGHIEGDNYIHAMCDAVRSFIRKIDIISRIGGDEFLIIFPRFTAEDARNVLASVSEKLDALSKGAPAGVMYRISYGVYEVNSSVPLDVEHILGYVDDKMYIMKAENRVKYGVQMRIT